MQGFFWVLSFAPIQSSQSLEIRSTPPPGGLEGLENIIAELHPHTKRARGQSPIAKECGNLSIPENLVIT